MSEIVFATQDTIIQPKGGLIVENPQEQDHVLGATGTAIAGPDFEVLVPDGQWSDYAPDAELQRNRFGDTFMCVSFSNNNVHEFIVRKRYGENTNLSDIFLGVGSGTVRGSGNGKRTVAEWKRLNGFVSETDYPYTQDMTLDQVFTPIPKDILGKGKGNLNYTYCLYKWLADKSQNGLMNGLKFSPIQADVSGKYNLDSSGYVVWNDGDEYAHEIVIFGYEQGKCWYVFDSESMQFIKFAWNYPFGTPMIHSIKKKMKIQILKEKGKSALAVQHCSEPSMIAFSGGSVQGENLFKSLYGVSSFNDIPITEVDAFPYPVHHLINTNLSS